MSGTSSRDTLDIIALLESGSDKPFALSEHLADQIADLMEAGDRHAAGCLHLIAAAYDHTDQEPVRLAIENGFLYRLGNRIFSGKNHRQMLALLPPCLHDPLMRQMLATGP